MPTPTATATIKRAPYPVEGAGSETFSNRNLIATVLMAPLALVLLVGLPLAWYPAVALLAALPTFAAYNYWYATVAPPVRPVKAGVLPGRPAAKHYLRFNDPALASAYADKKVPVETFFEAYFDQKIDLLDDGADLLELLEARYEWLSFTFTWNQAKFFLTQWIPELLWHSKKQDEDQVREHYDRGDDFYNWFLGPMMVYTSGIVTDPKRVETLEELQENKLRLVSDKIQLKPGDRHLDIGCGWGTLAIHSAKLGAKATGVTLSSNQAAWGRRKAGEAGVSIEVLRMDYRDIPAAKYDKITCLEMAEHVGVRKFQDFMLQVKDLLEDDGIFFLQIAGLRRAWQYEDLTWGLFMAKYVFPGADASTPLNWTIEQAERAGFEVLNIDTIGVHYSATIYRWYLNWLGNKDKVIEKYGVRWFRIWELFLAWSTIIARQGSATCYQLVLHKNLNGFDRTRFVGSKRLNADDGVSTDASDEAVSKVIMGGNSSADVQEPADGPLFSRLADELMLAVLARLAAASASNTVASSATAAAEEPHAAVAVAARVCRRWARLVRDNALWLDLCRLCQFPLRPPAPAVGIEASLAAVCTLCRGAGLPNSGGPVLVSSAAVAQRTRKRSATPSRAAASAASLPLLPPPMPP
ncbi:hypothetical protein HK405_009468, partial [Cladochytrium tenue]